MSTTFDVHSSRSPSAQSETGGKRKRASGPKYYAVRQGHRPGVYDTYPDCLEQVKGYATAQCKSQHLSAKAVKSFPTREEAEQYVTGALQKASRFTMKPNQFYAVKRGWTPGVYNDWPSAQKQISGFTNNRHKKFPTQAEAVAWVHAEDSSDDADPKTKRQRRVPLNEIDLSVEPGSGPMPPPSQDGFDPRIILNPISGQLQYKNEVQQNATKMQPTGPSENGMLKIYTDGSSLGNGQVGSTAGVGVYFGPLDKRNVSEPLKGSRQTNQRAELTAVQRAVELSPKDRDIQIFTDSNYAIKCLTEWFINWRRNGWKNSQKKAVENRDLIEVILQKIEERERLGSKTKFQWIKGHANDPGNEAADKLAVAGSMMARNGLHQSGTDAAEDDEDDFDGPLG